MGDEKTRVFPIKGVLAPKSNSFAYWDVGEFGEEEKALNLKEIVIWICDFQVGGLTCLDMALMLLGTMVLGEELGEEENENELPEEV